MKNLLILLTLVGVALSACSRTTTAPIAGEWTLLAYGDPAAPTSAAANVETSLLFGNEGELSGNVGCNGFGGDYTVDGDRIAFGPIVSTAMFCEAVAEQESETLAVLQESATFVLDGNTLTITSADGASFIVLERK